jgi:hypothetical protein
MYWYSFTSVNLSQFYNPNTKQQDTHCRVVTLRYKVAIFIEAHEGHVNCKMCSEISSPRIVISKINAR